jgi:hypothetical protein
MHLPFKMSTLNGKLYKATPNVKLWKKISRFARQKNKYSNSCVVQKIFSERNRNYWPFFVLILAQALLNRWKTKQSKPLTKKTWYLKRFHLEVRLYFISSMNYIHTELKKNSEQYNSALRWQLFLHISNCYTENPIKPGNITPTLPSYIYIYIYIYSSQRMYLRDVGSETSVNYTVQTPVEGRTKIWQL